MRERHRNLFILPGFAARLRPDRREPNRAPMPFPPALRPVALAGALLAAAATPAVANQAMIVFDGSGSMTKRIDGRTKIDIQRATLGRVFADAPETLAVGLMAYGHRQKESCSDVELLAAPDVGQ